VIALRGSIVLPRTTAAVLLRGHGGLDQLEYRTDVPVPRPGRDEVLIQVAAAGVNNADVNTRIGWACEGRHDSDRIECWTFGSECDGGFAQFTVAPPGRRTPCALTSATRSARTRPRRT
jgi:hypothetical protein